MKALEETVRHVRRDIETVDEPPLGKEMTRPADRLRKLIDFCSYHVPNRNWPQALTWREDGMLLLRRRLLKTSGSAAITIAAGARAPHAATNTAGGEPGSWEWVRGPFDLLSPDTVHMSAMLISSHPRPVREAIETHRCGLDMDPVRYLERHN